MPELLLIQTVLPDYRQPFVTELERRLGANLLVLTGTDHFDGTSRSGVDGRSVRAADRNMFFAGRRLLWQRGVLGPAVAAGTVVLELNPRVLSSWVVLAARRLRGGRTVLWGHAWGRRGDSAVRAVMRRCADALIVYTRTQRRQVAARMPGRPVHAAPNALCPAAAMEPVGPGGLDLVWVGRLVPAKKPELAVKAFAAAVDRLPSGSRLRMAGDGPQREAVQGLVAELGLGERVALLGHVPPDKVGALFGTAAVGVCTGYVGLNLIQSLGYGVPVMYPRDEPHAPEIEAATPANSRSFASDDVAAAADAMVAVVAAAPHDRVAIAADCRRRYSVEAMVDGFLGAAGLRATPVG